MWEERIREPGPAAVWGAKALGQLIATGIAVDLILGGVDPPGLGEDFGGDLLVGADRSVGGERSLFKLPTRARATSPLGVSSETG